MSSSIKTIRHGSQKEGLSRSRDTTFHVDKKLAPRVVTIYGGKLTAYGVTSEKFVLNSLNSCLRELVKHALLTFSCLQTLSKIRTIQRD